jgi:hypothetical protein
MGIKETLGEALIVLVTLWALLKELWRQFRESGDQLGAFLAVYSDLAV